MRAPAVRRAAAALVLSLALIALAVLPARAAAESCASVMNPYDGTRYEGIDLTEIEASGIGCTKARRVAKRAHLKGLGLAPDASGILRFRWHDWKVVGDLRPQSDRYVAKRDGDKVAWRF